MLHEVLPARPRVLLVYASTHGQTRKIANAIAARLREHDATVDVADIHAARPPAIAGYDVIGLGSRVHREEHDPALVAYIDRNHAALLTKPSFFFSVNLEKANRPHIADPGGYIADLVVSTSWRPDWCASFAGALRYSQYTWPMRWYMRARSSRHGQSIDASRDHDFTDWFEVRTFADRIASNWHSHQEHDTWHSEAASSSSTTR